MKNARRQAMQYDADRRLDAIKARIRAFLGAVAIICVSLGFIAFQLVVHPSTPLPNAWNPTQPLRISDDVTPLTRWKLDQTAEDFPRCAAALDGFADVQVMDPFAVSDVCFIQDRVRLSGAGASDLRPVDTRCATALRVAMWERHSLRAAAQTYMGADIEVIDHIGSYNCRQMRTTSGRLPAMSSHATANAIDITGFQFSDGRTITLLDDWDSMDGAADFLRAARDGACEWFRLTLSPDYNVLHADHFHLQSTGWGTCR